MNKNCLKIVILISFCSFFMLSTKKSDAKETAGMIAKKSGTNPITFDVKRNNGQLELENVSIDSSYGLGRIATVIISIPQGVKWDLTPPSGWTTSNQATDKMITYQLNANQSPVDVQNTLSGLRLTIVNENELEGKVTISLGASSIAAWTDPEDNNKPHYYKFVEVPAGTTITWLDAYNAARKLSYKNLRGYLATIKNESEHDYVYTIATKPGWLGGTRMKYGNNNFILGKEMLQSNNVNDYHLTGSEWYWADGPEAGQIFYNGRQWQGGSVPSGAYAPWNNTPSREQPDNAGHADGGYEYAVQFAFNNSKLWNDLPNTAPTLNHNRGYYVEFSQFEEGREEKEEDSYSADVPQRVKVQYLDEESNEAISLEPEVATIGDIFSIGTEYDVSVSPQPYRKEIAGYDFIRAEHEKGKHTNKVASVVYYYRKQTLNFHIQQVILDSNSQLTIPSKGYVKIRTVDALDPADVTTSFDHINTFATSLTVDADDYINTMVTRNPLGGRYYQVSCVQPAYYESIGYVLTDSKIAHTPAQLSSGIPVVDSNGKKEYWVTFYFKTMTEAPKPYSQFYINQSFGEIK